jgi:hypothetical protein
MCQNYSLCGKHGYGMQEYDGAVIWKSEKDIVLED